MKIEAFFRTALDARKAAKALQRLGVEVSDPIPVQRAQERPWVLEIDVRQGASAQRYISPVLVDQVHTEVLSYGGSVVSGAARQS